MKYPLSDSTVTEKDVATYTIIKLLLCFLVCYLPGGILRIIFLIQSIAPNLFDIMPNSEAGRERFFYVYLVLNLVLISLNSMLNPLVLIPSTATGKKRRATKLEVLKRSETISHNYN